MKNKLLITTALVAVGLATNVYADYPERIDIDIADALVVTQEKTLKNEGSGGVSAYNKWDRNPEEGWSTKAYEKITLEKGGNLNIISSDISTNSDMYLRGTLEMSDSFLRAGIDESGYSHPDMYIDGADVTLNDSDLASEKKLEISDSVIRSINNVEYGTNEYGESIGISSNDDITITKSEVFLENSGFDLYGGSLYIKDSEIELVNSQLSAWEGIDQKINITNSTINVSGDDNVFILDENEKVYLNASILNIDKESVLDLSKFDPTSDSLFTPSSVTLQLDDKSIINLSGELNGHIEGSGQVNFKQSNATVNGNIELTNDGTIDLGTNSAVVDGDVTFDTGSALSLKIASTDNYGNLTANTIDIGDNTSINVTLDNGVVANGETAEFKFLNGTVNGDFENKITENSRYAFDWADNGSLSITGQATASDVVEDAGGSANNVKTAEAWDSILSSSIVSANAKAVAAVLGDLSQRATTAAGQKAYVDALTAVAPDVAPMVQQTQTEVSNQVFSAVGTRLSGGSVATGSQGMASGDNPFERVVAWVQGLFNKSKLDDTSKAKGFDSDTYGTAFGIEKMLDNHCKVGVGYAYSNTDIDGFMRDTDVETHTALLYGEYKPSNWYVNGIATYGWSDYEENKNVAGIGVKADYDVETFGLQAMTGYEFNLNGVSVTPETGVRYVHISQDSYKDTADQKVSANDSDIFTGVIGAKVSKGFELDNGVKVRPEARLAATYDLKNDGVNSVVTLANGSAYQVNGKALDRFGMEFGAGVKADVDEHIELALGYEGKFRQDYQDHTGLINFKYKF